MQAAFRRADEVRELERLNQESTSWDAQEEAEFTAAVEMERQAELERAAEQERRVVRAPVEAPACVCAP